jgi:hypothetical protein
MRYNLWVSVKPLEITNIMEVTELAKACKHAHMSLIVCMARCKAVST